MAEAALSSCASVFSIGLRPRGVYVEARNGLLARKLHNEGTRGRKEARKIARRCPRKLPDGFFVHLRLFLFQRKSKKLLVDLLLPFYMLLMQALEQDFSI